jgi:hypothetical protein
MARVGEIASVIEISKRTGEERRGEESEVTFVDDCRGDT